MKNYYLELGRIFPSYRERTTNLDDEEIVSKYKIVKNSPYVEFTYFNGYTECELIDEVSIDEIKEKQRVSFDEMCDDVEKKANLYLLFCWCVYFSMLVPSCLDSKLVASISGIVCTFPCYVWWGVPAFRLVKEIKDTRWIIENKDDVDRIIKEDYDKAYTLGGNEDTLIPTKILSGELHYPEELYEDGISLNNIDLLSRKEIAKLKRKVIKRRGM